MADTFQKAQQQGQIRDVKLETSANEIPLVRLGESSVYDDRKKGVVKKPLLVPAYQSSVIQQNKDFLTLPLPNTTTNMLSSTSVYTYNIPSAQARRVVGLRLNVQVNESGGANSITLNPVNFWINRIELVANGGSGAILNTICGEQIWCNYSIYMDHEDFLIIAPYAGLTSAYAPSLSGNSSLVLSASGYNNYVINLWSFFNVVRPVLQAMNQDIQLKIYYRSIVSAGSGTLNLGSNALNLVLEHNDLSDMDLQLNKQLYFENVLKYTYLDCINVSQTLTITKSIQNKINLQSLKCKVAFALVMIRSSVSPTSQGFSTLACLGTQNIQTPATLDIQDPAGVGQLNHGTAMNLTDLSYVSSRFFKGNMFILNQNIYPIIFSTNIDRALSGDQSSGFFYFNGDPYNLVLTPDTNWSNATYTVDMYAYYYKDVQLSSGEITVRNY